MAAATKSETRQRGATGAQLAYRAERAARVRATVSTGQCFREACERQAEPGELECRKHMPRGVRP